MRCTTTLDKHVDAASDAERDRILGILKTAYDQGRAEASMTSTWSDAYNTGFAASLTALQQLVLKCSQ
jgi:hypothetical protein